MNDLLSLGILYVLGIFVLIYFFTVLPARKKHKRVQAMHAAVKEGDEVVTSGLDGIFFSGISVGKVTGVIQESLYKSAAVKPYVNITIPSYLYVVTKEK